MARNQIWALFGALLFVALVQASGNKQVEELDDELSQLAFGDSFEMEGAQLTGDLKVFDDFCVMGRDYVFAEIKKETNSAASNAFSLLFGLVETLGQGAVDIIQAGNVRLTSQLANPDAEIEEPDSKAAAILAGGQERVKGAAESQAESFVQAFKSILSATNYNVRKVFGEKLAALQELASQLGSLSTLQVVCEKVIGYEKRLEGQFEAYKNGAEQELGKILYTLEKVPCKTTTRVVRIAGLCHLAKSVAPAVNKFLGTVY